MWKDKKQRHNGAVSKPISPPVVCRELPLIKDKTRPLVHALHLCGSLFQLVVVPQTPFPRHSPVHGSRPSLCNSAFRITSYFFTLFKLSSTPQPLARPLIISHGRSLPLTSHASLIFYKLLRPRWADRSPISSMRLKPLCLWPYVWKTRQWCSFHIWNICIPTRSSQNHDI